MTHLADVADRIDRSYSPRGGREERELENWIKEHAASCRSIVKLRTKETKSHRFCSTGANHFRFVHE